MWQPLYETLQINPTLGMALPLPTQDDLDGFEQKYSMELPQEYQSFAIVFGPGEIGKWFRVYVPSAGKKSLADLATLQESFTTNRKALADCFPDDAAFYNRLIPFADSLDGDVIGWDVEDAKGGKGGEYGIYVITRGDTRILHLVNSFREFIEEVCLGNLFAKIMHYPKWEACREFTPYGGGDRRTAAVKRR